MTIRVLAFGIARDIFQNDFDEVESNSEITVNGLKAILEEKYPRLKLLKSYMIAVNNVYANGEQAISTVDEVALIPPVSGG